MSTRLYLALCVGSQSYKDVRYHFPVITMALNRGYTSIEVSRSGLLFCRSLSQFGDSSVHCVAVECHTSSHGSGL